MRPVLSACAAALVLAASVPAQDVVLPDGKAKTLIQNTCSECHGLDTVVSAAMSPEKWRATVNKMVKKGATLSPEEIDTVVDYLTVYFAQEKLNINSASSQELQSAMQLTPAEGDAIVAYRKANGNFKDIEGLRKVTGLDVKKIEAKKDQLAF
ncbi:MAG TPA: helix-hairpin-helix domain-containing protein [Bryobacteraceae bacterium]|nr:helix-hairpin-helix domain-containing protein [Bryobacteraceae bacterium]